MKTSKMDSFADKTGSDDKEKQIYLTQIRYLNEELERYQLKCDELERQKTDLNSQYSALQKDKKDISEYLKRSLLKKEDEMDKLTERLESQQQAADKDRDVLQLQHSQLRQELQVRIQEVSAENTTLVARLASLEEFQIQKEQLMSNMESLEKQLASQEEENKAALHCLEMKALLEKKRLEKALESHAEAMATEVQRLVDQKVPETTKLALKENTEVKTRISELSEKTLVLMEESLALRDGESLLRVEVDLLEKMLSQTSRQSAIHKKVVEQLTEKSQQLQAELKGCKQELKQLQTKNTGVLAEMEALRKERASLSEQCCKKTAKVSVLQMELQDERRRRSRMKCIMQEAALTLSQALMHGPTDQDSEADSVAQWRHLMEELLGLLHRTTLTNSTAEQDQQDEWQTSNPAAARKVTLNAALGLQFDRTRYMTGNCGFVPHPTLKHKLVPSRAGAAGSSSSHVPLHRKPPSQKTASSRTDSAVRLRNSFSKLK